MKSFFKKEYFLKLLTALFGVIIIILVMNNYKENKMVTATKKYLSNNNIVVTENILIKAIDLINEGYDVGLNNKCVDKTYVIVSKKNNKLVFDVNEICQEDDLSLSILLNGDSEIMIEVFNHYIELGANAYINTQLNNDYLSIDSESVNENEIGEYEVIYTLNYKGNIEKITRKVIVVDNTAPTITLKGNDVVSIFVGDNYDEAGFMAIDNYDGDITDKVKIEKEINTNRIGSYFISYMVSDNNDNITKIIRTVNVIEPSIPIINLYGENIIYLEYFQAYIEPGFIALDQFEGNITNKVQITSDLDINNLGVYLITYSVTNNKNKTQIVTRKVVVQDTTAPIITGINNNDFVNQDVTISFNEGSALLNGNPFNNNSTISESGEYTLVVTDDSNNQSVVNFTILKQTANLEMETVLDDNPDIAVDTNGDLIDDFILDVTSFKYIRSLVINNETIVLDELEENIPKVLSNNPNSFITLRSGIITIGTTTLASTTYTIAMIDKAGNISNDIIATIQKGADGLNTTLYSSHINNQFAKIGDILTLDFNTKDSKPLSSYNVSILGINANLTVNDFNYKATVSVADTFENGASVGYVIDYVDYLGRLGQVLVHESGVLLFKEITATITYDDSKISQGVLATINTDHEINIPQGYTKIDNTTYQKTYIDNGFETIDIEDLAGNTTNVEININNICRIIDKVVGGNRLIAEDTSPSFIKFTITFNNDIEIVKATDFRIYYEYSLDEGQTWIASRVSFYNYKSLLGYPGLLTLNGVKLDESITKNFTIFAGTTIAHTEVAVKTRLTTIYNAIVATGENGNNVYTRNIIGIVKDNHEEKYILNTVVYSNSGLTAITLP